MEDTTIIMKINTLAKELRAHNPELTRDEAALQAEKMITGKSGEFARAIKLPEEALERKSIEQELSLLTNRLNNVIMELATLKSSHAELQQQLKMLSDEFAFVKNRAARTESGVERRGEGSEELEKKERQVTLEKSKPLNFSEKDVSVDKIFYFGKK